MIRNLLFHTIKGKNLKCGNILDVAKIEHMFIKKRLFMIRDRNLPYKLVISYSEPRENLQFVPGISIFGGFTSSIANNVDLMQVLTFRYSSKDVAQKEIDEINSKRDKLEKLGDKLLGMI